MEQKECLINVLWQMKVGEDGPNSEVDKDGSLVSQE